MVSTPGYRRVRRPKDKSILLDDLTKSENRKISPFDSYRDAIIFCAALGWWRKRRVSFSSSDEPIRWETMASLPGAEMLVNMLAVSQTEDPTILLDDRFDDRIVIFEEYANGGLEILRDSIDQSHKLAVDILRDLVEQADIDIHTNIVPIDLTDIELDR